MTYVSYAVSICVFAGAIGGLIGSKYAKFCGVNVVVLLPPY